MARKMEAIQKSQSSLKPFALGFGAGAILLGGIVATASRDQSSAELEKRLLAAETLNSRLEHQNKRMMDEVVEADVRFKVMQDRLQSNNSLTSAVKTESKQDGKTPKPEERSFGIEREPDLDSMISEMKGFAYSNYEKVKKGERPLYYTSAIPILLSTARKHGLNVSTFEELKSFFEKQGKYLLVANFGTRFGIVCNVHLANIVSKEKKSITIDGKTISFNSYGIEGSAIRDFTEYDSDGKIYLICSVVKNDVIHNMIIVNSRADAAWRLFKYGESSRIEFLDKIARAEFRELYYECTRKGLSENGAKEEFVKRVAELYMRDADINEAYHISVTGTKFDTSDVDENVRSVYFNYIHTPLRQASFYSEAQGLFHAKKGSKNNETAKIVFTEFIEYIREKQKSGRFNNIRISGNTLEDQIQNLYLLTGDEIKEIAKILYERKIAKF